MNTGGASRLLTQVAFFVSAILLPGFAAAAELSGKVVGVTDGDTIRVLVDNEEIRVRLHGIDCPERSQPFHSRAKQFTSEAVFGKTVRAEVRDTDRYGRTVAVVWVDGRNLNESLVAAGLAWWYRRYAPEDEGLKLCENQARSEQLGLWGMPDPVPPWEWRRQVRPAR